MKILITHAYAGIGHKKAAEAVYEVLAHFKDVDATVVDVLDYTNAFFKFLYPSLYSFLINRAPFLWGFFYYLLDFNLVDIFLAPGRNAFHNYVARRFGQFVLKENPDVIICTHFLPAEVVSGLKRKNIFKGKLVTVITDFLPHSFWLARASDYFIVAVERTKKDLLRRGIEEGRIKVLGIPCNPVFSISKPRQALLEKLGLREGFFNLLIMRGGFGTSLMTKIVNGICSVEPEIKNRLQLVIICGNNKKLSEELKKIRASEFGLGGLSVFGYMDNIDEFMEVSDCIITKSGGLTVSEALSKKLPMIVIQPIPGQETRNCKILVGYGTAVRVNSVKQTIDCVRDFIRFPERIIGMKARLGLLAYPDAAERIAEFVLRVESL